jgi:hypothetical protein
MAEDAAGAALIAAFEQQVRWCAGPAPFSARVLQASVRWLRSNDEARAELAAVAPDPLAAAVALRWLAGLHHLALRGLRPWAAVWPPGSGEADDATLDTLVGLAWAFQGEALRQALAHPPQTNEVQRSAALVPGLAFVAARTKLPLALLEIGASAGLNLWPEHLAVETPGWRCGPVAAPLVLRPSWEGPVPEGVQQPLEVAFRAACDVQPVDLTAEGEDLRLASFVWADQRERLERLFAATALVQPLLAAEGVRVQPARAATWLRQQLGLRLPGQALVLMHSVMWQYLEAAEQAQITQLLRVAGAMATPEAPLAWLRLEPPVPDVAMELRCRLWLGPDGPGGLEGTEHLLAHAHPHGANVRWVAGTDAAAAEPMA